MIGASDFFSEKSSTVLTFDVVYGNDFIAVAARGGMETLRPVLQRLYMTKASSYRDALKSFIEGYQEGIQQVMEKKEDSKAQKEGNIEKTST